MSVTDVDYTVPTVDVDLTIPTVDIVIGVGPRGPQGAPGAGMQHDQTVAAGAWTITVPAAFDGRLPSVTVWVDDEIVEADVTSSGSIVTITFPQPTAGSAVLT